jgi:hypothetical protein
MPRRGFLQLSERQAPNILEQGRMEAAPSDFLAFPPPQPNKFVGIMCQECFAGDLRGRSGDPPFYQELPECWEKVVGCQ